MALLTLRRRPSLSLTLSQASGPPGLRLTPSPEYYRPESPAANPLRRRGRRPRRLRSTLVALLGPAREQLLPRLGHRPGRPWPAGKKPRLWERFRWIKGKRTKLEPSKGQLRAVKRLLGHWRRRQHRMLRQRQRRRLWADRRRQRPLAEELLLGPGALPRPARLRASLRQFYPSPSRSWPRPLRRRLGASLQGQLPRRLRPWALRNLSRELPRRRLLKSRRRRKPQKVSTLALQFRRRLRSRGERLHLLLDSPAQRPLLRSHRRAALGRRLVTLGRRRSLATLLPLLVTLHSLGSLGHRRSLGRRRSRNSTGSLRSQLGRRFLTPLLGQLGSTLWANRGQFGRSSGRRLRAIWARGRWRRLRTLSQPRGRWRRSQPRSRQAGRPRLRALLANLASLGTRRRPARARLLRRRLAGGRRLLPALGRRLRRRPAPWGQPWFLGWPRLQPWNAFALGSPRATSPLQLALGRRPVANESFPLLGRPARLGVASFGRRQLFDLAGGQAAVQPLFSAARLEQLSQGAIQAQAARRLAGRRQRRHWAHLHRERIRARYPVKGEMSEEIRIFNRAMKRYRKALAQFGGQKGLRPQSGNRQRRLVAALGGLALLGRRSLALGLQLGAPLGGPLGAPLLLAGRQRQRLDLLANRGSWSYHYYHGQPRPQDESWIHRDRGSFTFLYNGGEGELFPRNQQLRHGRLDLGALALGGGSLEALGRLNCLGNARELLLAKRLRKWIPRYCLEILLTPRRNNLFCTILPLVRSNRPGERIFHLSAGQVCHRKGYLRRSAQNRRELYGRAAFRLLRYAKKDKRFRFLVVRIKHYYDAINRVGQTLAERLWRSHSLFRPLARFQNDLRYPIVSFRLQAAQPSHGGKVGLSPRRKKRLRPAKVRSL